jgi:proliferating cell nuclear antigen
MNVKIKNHAKAELFTSLFQHIKLLTEHINIMFEKERLYIQTMDSARVSILEIELPSSWFDEYNHDGNNLVLGIHSTIFFKILNSRDKLQELEICYDNEDTDKLFIHFTCENTAIFDKHFEIPLIELESELMSIPEITSQADITMASSNFANIISQLQMFGETLDVQCSEDKIVMTSISNETGKMYVDINIDDLNSFAIDDGKQLTLSYSLRYLHIITLYSKIAKEIEIKMTEDYPLKIVYYLGDENSKMTFFLAPKIDDDE